MKPKPHHHEQLFGEDLDLVSRALENDHDAEIELIERILTRTEATVRYMVSDIEEHEDWIQDAVLEVLSSLKTYKGTCQVEYWAHTIIVRSTVKKLKKHIDRRSRWALWERLDQFRSSYKSQGDVRSDAELGELLTRTIQKLSAKKRAVVVLKLVHGYSLNEISDILNLPVNTIRERLRTGRKELRSALLKDRSAQIWLEEFCYEN